MDNLEATTQESHKVKNEQQIQPSLPELQQHQMVAPPAQDVPQGGEGDEDPVAKKRRERLEQNRISARESRKRKKTMIEELQRTVITLSRENKQLNQTNESIRRQLIELGAKYPGSVPISALMAFDQQAKAAVVGQATGPNPAMMQQQQAQQQPGAAVIGGATAVAVGGQAGGAGAGAAGGATTNPFSSFPGAFQMTTNPAWNSYPAAPATQQK